MERPFRLAALLLIAGLLAEPSRAQDLPNSNSPPPFSPNSPNAAARSVQNLPNPNPPPPTPENPDRESLGSVPIPSAEAPNSNASMKSSTARLQVTVNSVRPEPSDRAFPINLATALRLSDARPLVVAAAQAGVWVAEAELTRTKVLWLPSLNFGADYIRHDGGGPDFNKGILTSPSTNFFYGGLGATGNLPTVDAIFDPLAARQALNARHWDVQTAKNDVLLKTADAYFQVHRYRGTYAGALDCVRRGRELVTRITRLSRDLVPRVEIDRAQNLLADLEQRAVSARQEWRVKSADLTEVLRLDPRSVLVPLEHDHTQITLIDPGRCLDDLMTVALTNRPELASKQAMVQAALAQIRRERARPFTPNLLLNGFQTPSELIQAGIFGLGPNSSLNQWTGRDDFSVQPLWALEAFGIGNLARIKGQRGMQSMAIIDFFRTQDMIAADVTRSQARVQSAAARVLQADRSLRTGIVTYNGNFEGLQQTMRFGDVLTLVNRPQEAVFALQLLYTAYDEYFTTVSEYNRAQFEVFHALGYPAQEVTSLRPPGEVLPVDTNRPGYLPPVGNGPPPATR